MRDWCDVRVVGVVSEVVVVAVVAVARSKAGRAATNFVWHKFFLKQGLWTDLKPVEAERSHGPRLKVCRDVDFPPRIRKEALGVGRF